MIIILAAIAFHPSAHPAHPVSEAGGLLPALAQGEQKAATRKGAPVARALPSPSPKALSTWRPCVISTYHEYEGEHTTASGEPFKDEGFTCAVHNGTRRSWMDKRYTVVLWWLGKTVKARCNDVFIKNTYKKRIDVSEGVVFELTGKTNGLYPDKNSDLQAFFYLLPEDPSLKGAVNKKLLALRNSRKTKKGDN